MPIIEDLDTFSNGTQLKGLNDPALIQVQHDTEGDYLRLANTLELRAKAKRAANDLDDHAVAARKAQDEADAFDHFAEGLKGVDVSDPTAVAEHARQELARNPKLAGVQEMQDWFQANGQASELKGRASDERVKAKKNQLEEKQADDDLTQFDTVRELGHQRQSLALKQTQAAIEQIDGAQQTDHDMTLNQFQQQLGGAQFDQSLKDGFARMAGALDTPKDQPKLKQLSALMAAANSMGFLEQSMAHEQSYYMPILRQLAKANIDPSNEAAVTREVGNDPDKKAQWEMAKHSMAKLSDAKKVRAKILEYIPGSLERLEQARASGDEARFNGEMAVLGSKVNGIKGMVQTNLEKQKMLTEQQGEELKINKLSQEMRLADTADKRKELIERNKPLLQNQQMVDRVFNIMVNRGLLKPMPNEKPEAMVKRLMKLHAELGSNVGTATAVPGQSTLMPGQDYND